MTVCRTVASSTLAAAFLLLLMVQIAPASAQTSGSTVAASTTVSSYSTGTNIPASTGCTTPGDAAPASLITTLGTNTTQHKEFKDAPWIDQVMFLGGLALTGLLVLIGIVWLVVLGVTRGSRRAAAAQGQKRRSHAGRYAFIAIFLVVILITATGFYLVEPYLGKNQTVYNGVLQNIINPNDQFGVNPLSIKFFYVDAYANNASTLLEGNFSVAAGPDVQVVILNDSLRNQWFGDLENGTFAGMSGCTMAGIPTLYDSGFVSSGAFAVAIPPVNNLTVYDVIFANPSTNQTNTLAANVYYGY